MANEKLQKLGYGSTRAAITAASSVELREPVINIHEALNQEMIIKYDPGSGEQEFHWPSEERIAIGITPPSDGVIESGSEIISVKGTFANLTESNGTSKSLLDVITEIDDKLGSSVSTILNDGSRDMVNDWNCRRSVSVGNLTQYDTNKDLNVIGSGMVLDATIAYDFGPAALPAFGTDAAAWSVVDVSYDAISKHTYSGTVSTTGSMSIDVDAVESRTAFKTNEWYVMTYDIVSKTGTPTMSFSDEFADETTSIETTVGETKKVLVKTLSDNSGDLLKVCKIEFTGTTGDLLVIENLSIKRVTGGTLDMYNAHITGGITVNCQETYDDSLEAEYTGGKWILKCLNPNTQQVGNETTAGMYIDADLVKHYSRLPLWLETTDQFIINAGSSASLRHQLIFSTTGVDVRNVDSFIINAGSDDDGDFIVKGGSANLIETDAENSTTTIKGLIPHIDHTASFVSADMSSAHVTLTSAATHVNISNAGGSYELRVPKASLNNGKVIVIYNGYASSFDYITPFSGDTFRLGDLTEGFPISVSTGLYIVLISDGVDTWEVMGAATFT